MLTPPVSARPTSEQIDDWVNSLERTQLTTYRLRFTPVEARRTNGHVQGIAMHLDKRDSGKPAIRTIYMSMSDFPPGWGACLINDDRPYEISDPHFLEAMTFPQGSHPGGINICGDFMVVPIEHDRRVGRLYLYHLVEPLYPVQVGHFDSYMFDKVAPRSKNGRRRLYRGVELATWPTEPGWRRSKASSAAIVEQTDGCFLVAVLSEHSHLRFIRFANLGCEEHPQLAPTESFSFDARFLPRWPCGFVDNISMLASTGPDGTPGISLVVFSAEGLSRLIKTPTSRTVDRVTCLHLEVDFEHQTVSSPDCQPTTGRLPSLRPPGAMLWPGFRWGASATWTGTELGLLVAEYFGDEESGHPDGEGDLQFVQFMSNLDLDDPPRDDRPASWTGVEFEPRRPKRTRRLKRLAPDALGLTAGLFRHWLRSKRREPLADGESDVYHPRSESSGNGG